MKGFQIGVIANGESVARKKSRSFIVNEYERKNNHIYIWTVI